MPEEISQMDIRIMIAKGQRDYFYERVYEKAREHREAIRRATEAELILAELEERARELGEENGKT